MARADGAAVPELDPDRDLIVGRKHLDRVPPYPERAGLERKVVALVVNANQVRQNRVPSPPIASTPFGSGTGCAPSGAAIGAITVATGAANGYTLGELILEPGETIAIGQTEVASTRAAVAAGAKILDVSGTGTDSVDIVAVFGDA